MTACPECGHDVSKHPTYGNLSISCREYGCECDVPKELIYEREISDKDAEIAKLRGEIEARLCQALTDPECTCDNCMYHEAIKEINKVTDKLQEARELLSECEEIMADGSLSATEKFMERIARLVEAK